MDGSVCLVELQCGQKPVESVVDVSSGQIKPACFKERAVGLRFKLVGAVEAVDCGISIHHFRQGKPFCEYGPQNEACKVRDAGLT